MALTASGVCECSNRIGTCPSLLPEDWMNHDDANGSCVVEAVLKQLDKSRIFQQDHRFMRRIAYVETRDGRETVHENVTETGCHKRVGIWGMTSSILQTMKNKTILVEHPDLNNVSRHICEAFGVNMTGYEKLNLRNTLVAGIAARFYIYYIAVVKGLKFPENVAEQASFWQFMYRENDSFTQQVRFEDHVTEPEGWFKLRICNVDICNRSDLAKFVFLFRWRFSLVTIIT